MPKMQNAILEYPQKEKNQKISKARKREIGIMPKKASNIMQQDLLLAAFFVQ